MEFLVIIFAIVVLLYVLHRLALAAESRGWIFDQSGRGDGYRDDDEPG